MPRSTFGALVNRMLSQLTIYTVAPRVEEIGKLTGQRVHARLRQHAADGIRVIDHESKMTAVVGGPGAALLEREERPSRTSNEGIYSVVFLGREIAR